MQPAPLSNHLSLTQPGWALKATMASPPFLLTPLLLSAPDHRRVPSSHFTHAHVLSSRRCPVPFPTTSQQASPPQRVFLDLRLCSRLLPTGSSLSLKALSLQVTSKLHPCAPGLALRCQRRALDCRLRRHLGSGGVNRCRGIPTSCRISPSWEPSEHSTHYHLQSAPLL
jgi:hypothetical protein